MKVSTLLVGTALSVAMVTPAVTAFDDDKRTVDSFAAVAVHGSMDVDIKIGGKQSVTVTAPADLLPKIVTEVKGSTLKIGYEKGFKWDKKWNKAEIKVSVTAPSLHGANIHGSGDITLKGDKGDKFEMVVQGSGDIEASSMNYGMIAASVKGSGDLDVTGKCDALTVSVMGSGDVEAGDLKCSSADVAVKGSGDVTVFASGKAKARVWGSGDIYVKGSPKKVDKKTSGSGDIHT